MKIAIVGGGASGLMAAITAASQGAEVTILEHRERIGKKLLMTGNGKCNLSNLSFSDSDYYSDEPQFVAAVLRRFTKDDTVRFFERIGLLLKSRNGGIYPVTEQASAVLDVLRMEVKQRGVVVLTEIEIAKITKTEAFHIQTNKGDMVFDRIILACGSKANPQTGSDGSGYELAKKLGHRIIKPLPALVQLRCKGDFWKAVSGVRCEAAVQLFIAEHLSAEEKGELQLTEYGISGIVIFQFSRLAAKALDAGKEVFVRIDFLPQLSADKLQAFAARQRKFYPQKTIASLLLGVVHKKIAQMLLTQKGIKATLALNELPKESLQSLLSEIKSFQVAVKAVNPFAGAQVCCGGVDCSEIGKNCNSLLVEGLYFAGEMLDVDGKCGGYNLQWAWSSGFVAGEASAGGKKYD